MSGPVPWVSANLMGMTPLPFALKLLEPSAFSGCLDGRAIGVCLAGIGNPAVPIVRVGHRHGYPEKSCGERSREPSGTENLA